MIPTSSRRHTYPALGPVDGGSNTFGGAANLLATLQGRGHEPDGDDAEINWRDPRIEWVIAQQASSERLPKTLLDATRRGSGR